MNIPHKNRLTIALVPLLLLAGCAGSGFRKHQPLAEPMQIEAGSILTLTAPLTFPPGAAAIYLQDNHIVGANAIVQSYPYCTLVAPRLPAAGTIEPGAYAVENVEYDDKAIGASGNISSVTRIRLVANAEFPYNLNCQWPDGGGQGFLTSEEIQGVIGDLFNMALQR